MGKLVWVTSMGKLVLKTFHLYKVVSWLCCSVIKATLIHCISVNITYSILYFINVS